MALLTKRQIRNLADIVLEEFGSRLTGSELADRIALLLEDISGFELASDREIRHVINQTRRTYNEIAHQKTRIRKSQQPRQR
jgi:hypothetical protein